MQAIEMSAGRVWTIFKVLSETSPKADCEFHSKEEISSPRRVKQQRCGLFGTVKCQESIFREKYSVEPHIQVIHKPLTWYVSNHTTNAKQEGNISFKFYPV